MPVKTNTLAQIKNIQKAKDKNDDTKIDETKINSIIIGSCFGGDFESDKRGDENVIVKGEPFKIDWDHPITHHINTVPEMQKLLPIWLTPKNYLGVYTIDWDLEIKWISKEQSPDKTFSYTFHNRIISNDPGGTDLPIPDDDNTIIGGDEITLTINEFFYFDEPNQLKKPIIKKITGMKILGSNGDDPDHTQYIQLVKDYINAHDFPQPIDMPLSEDVSIQDQRKQMQVIIDKESSYFQFFDERMQWTKPPPEKYGYTYTNTSSDWGLCQLNKTKTDPSIPELWNWKANINSGIHFLWTEKFEQLKRDYNDGGFYEIKERLHKNGIEVPNLNRQEFLIWLAQRYHGGQYYKDYTPGKKGEKGTWVINPKHRSYGDDFCVRFGFSECKK